MADFAAVEITDAELQDVIGSVPDGADSNMAAPTDTELDQVWQDNVYGAFLAAPQPMTDSPSTDDIPGQNYTQEALLRAAESGDYAKVVRFGYPEHLTN